jgi:hypothetical protein
VRRIYFDNISGHKMVDIAGRPIMKRIMLIGFFLSITLVFSAQAQNQTALEKRLAYLNNLPEISWVKFDGNNVYIGLNKVSSNLDSIVRGAAVFGNKAYGLGMQVWAVRDTTNVPAIDFKYYCAATARHGKVQKSDCFSRIDERFEPSRRYESK